MKKSKIVSVLSVALLLASCGSTSGSGDTTGTNTTITTSSTEEIKNELLSFTVNPSYKAYKNSLVLDDVGDLKKDGGDASKYPHNGFFKNKDGGKDSYKVGSENAFQVHCYGSYLDETLNLVNEEIVDVNHKLEVLKDDGTYLDVTSEESTYVDVVGTNYNFTNAAVGRSFKLTLTPDETKFEGGNYSDEMEFDVVDAWNVYNAADLAYLDNFDVNSPYISSSDKANKYIVDAWAEMRDYNIAKDVKGIVLQNDIYVTSDDIPSEIKLTEKEVEKYIERNTTDFQTWAKNKFKNYEENGEQKERTDAECYEEGKALLTGSLKDFVNVYHRMVPEDEKFTFDGNYFTLDITGIKKVVKFRDKNLTNSATSNGSHSNLFGFPGDTGLGNEDAEGILSPFQINAYEGEILMNNLNIKGNAPMADDTANLGGLICIKVASKNFVATNVNSSDTFITFFPRPNDEFTKFCNTTIDRCRWYNSYSSMLFIYGTTNNKISNSIMSGAGGALMILSEPYAVDYKDSPKHTGAKADVTNSFLEAYVNGQESWFVDKNATSYIPMLANFQKNILDLLKKDYGGTSGFVKENNGSAYVNLISLHLDSGSMFNNKSTGSPLKGSLNIDGVNAINLTDYHTSTGDLYPLASTMEAMGQQMLLFKSSNGGMAAAGATDGSEMLTYSSAFASLDTNTHTAVAAALGQASPQLGALATYNLFPASQHTAIGGALRNSGITPVADQLDANWSNLVNGEYLSVMMQPTVQDHCVGLVVGYNAQ